MNSFYLELVSNASSQVYPQNAMASFTNFLPDKIELDGSWEVALVEVSYPGICYNIEGGLMTFHYDEKFKHVFAIPPAVFNSMDEFAKSLTDIPKKARHPKNLDPQFSINIDKKSRRLTFCKRGSQNVSFIKSLAANLGVEADKPVMPPDSKGSYNTKSWATADLPFDITGTHTVLLYLDIVEPNSVGDVKCPLLRSFPFKHREFHNDENFKRSQVLSYCSFEHLRFHKVIKSNFHSIHVELRNAAGHLVPFFPIGQVQLTLLFQKKS